MPSLRSIHPLWILLPVLLAPSAVWIASDHSVWPWDQAWYGQVSVQLWWALQHSWHEWLKTMLTGINLKPPGIVWLGQFFVPLRHVTASVEAALLLSILLAQALLLAIVYRIGRTLAPQSPLPAVAGVVFAAAAQAFVGLSEQFFVEPLQALAVAWTLWIALESRKWPAARVLTHLAAALLLGALAKATTPVYCVVFCGYTAVSLARRPLRLDLAGAWRVPSSRWLMLSFAALLPFAAAWYTTNLKAVWEHVRLASSGEVALQYGFRAPFWQKSLVWAALLRESFLAPFSLWALAGAAAAVVILRTWPAKLATTAIALAAAQTALVLAMFSVNDAVDPRYMYALIVNVAVVFMALCASLRSRALVAALVAVCAVQWAAANGYALGNPRLLSHSQWLQTPHPDRTEYEELTRIVERTSVAAGRYNIVGVEEPWLNSNSASFFAAKNQLNTGVFSYYTSLGYAATDMAATMRRMDELHTLFFVTLEEASQTKPPNFLNQLSAPVLRRIESDPRRRRTPFPSRKGILIFEPLQ